MQWEAYAIGADRCTTVLAVGRWDTCAEEAHVTAFRVYEGLKARAQRAATDDLKAISERAEGEPRSWIWALAGTTFGVRQHRPPEPEDEDG